MRVQAFKVLGLSTQFFKRTSSSLIVVFSFLLSSFHPSNSTKSDKDATIEPG